MGSIQTRPVNQASTADNAQIGVPCVEFARYLGGGVYDSYRDLGIVNTAGFAKELNVIQLPNRQSGIEQIVAEVVQRFEARLNLGIYDHGGENMRLLFAAESLTETSAGTEAIVDEVVYLQDSTLVWSDLAYGDVLDSPAFAAVCAEITDEAIGTGDGTLGDASGDYSLDFKPLLVADVTSITVAGVAYTPIAVGTASAGNEVEVVVGTGATSGDLQFFVGGSPANVTGAILGTYQPSHTLTENTDYAVDYQNGRIRSLSFVAGSAPLRANQPLELDYTRTTYEGWSMPPFTQFVFAGRARIRLLTDIGINKIWVIPAVNLRLTDDEFTYNGEEFQESQLSMTLVDDGTDTPYGTMYVYPESAA